MAELGLGKQKNAVIEKSDRLVDTLETQKTIMSKNVNTFLEVFKNTLTVDNKFTDSQKRDCFNFNTNINNSKAIINEIVKLFNVVIDNFKNVASDTEFDTVDSNRQALAQIQQIITDNSFSDLVAEFKHNISTIHSYKEKFGQEYNNSKKTGGLITPAQAKLITQIDKIFKDAVTSAQRKLDYVERIPKILSNLFTSVSTYVEFKATNETLSSMIKQKGLVRGSLQSIKKNGVKDFAKGAKKSILGKMGIDEHDNKRTKLRKVGGLALGAAGILAGTFLKSEGIGIAAGAYLAKRQERIKADRERYTKNLNVLHKQRESMRKALHTAIRNRQDINEKTKMRLGGAFAGGGLVKAIKDSNILVGERKLGSKFVPEHVKTSFGLNGIVKSPTSISLEKGETAEVESTKAGGVSTYNKNALKPISGKFGGGTDATNDNNPNDIVNPIVAAINAQTAEARLFHEKTLADAADAANKSKGFSTDKKPEDKNQAQIVKDAIKDKGLVGAMVDTVKNRITEKIVDKAFGGAQNMTAGNVARAGGRAALTVGGAAAVGYGGYKAAGMASEAMGLEQGGMADTAVKGVGAVGGALLGGFAGKKLANKIPFLKNVAKEDKNAPDVQKVNVVNADEIAGASKGDSITDAVKDAADALPTKGGGKLLGKLGGVGKMLGGAGRLMGKVAAPLAIATAAYDGVKGFNNADEIAGTEKGKATLGQKMGAAGSSVLSGLSFGMIKPDTIYKGISGIFDKQNKTEEELAKAKEEQAKKESENQLGFWDKLSSSDNPLLKSLGNAVTTVKNVASSASTAYTQARASGGSVWEGAKAAVGAGKNALFESKYQQYAPTVQAAASKNGLSEGYMKTMMNIESGGNANATSSTGAAGLYQFTKGTGKGYGLTSEGRYDPNANINAAARLSADNKKQLQAKGIEASDANLYLAHQQGVGGVAQLHKAAQSGVISPELRRNMDVNGGKGMDAKQFLEFWQQQYYKKAAQSGVTYDKNGTPTANVAQATNNKASYVAAIDAQAATNDVNATPEQKAFLAANGYKPTTAQAKSNIPKAPVSKTPDRIQIAQAEINMTKESDRQKTIEKEKLEQQMRESIISGGTSGSITSVNNSTTNTGSTGNVKVTTSDNSMLGMYAALLGRV